MSLILRSLSDLSLGESLRSIQKTVHTHPGYLWAWPMIPYIMIVMGSVDKNPSLVGGYLKLAQSKGLYNNNNNNHTVVMFFSFFS